MATGSGGLERFLGGVEYGSVEGPITNEISGSGRFTSSDAGYTWTSGTSRFIGGSLYGDVGSDATLGSAVDTSDLTGLLYTDDYVIKNYIDTSNFTNGRACYIGTNFQTGIVKGNVINLVKAGTDNNGSLSVFFPEVQVSTRPSGVSGRTSSRIILPLQRSQTWRPALTQLRLHPITSCTGILQM